MKKPLEIYSHRFVPDHMNALAELASDKEMTVGEYLRRMIQRELRNHNGTAKRNRNKN